jgi:EmrB/QacA subfamily drug resistance transporter
MTDAVPPRLTGALAEAGPGPSATGRPSLVVLIPLMLVAFVYTLDQTIVATALPSIGRAFHSLSEASWVASAYLLTSAVSTLVFGKLGDMHGRKRIFQVALVVFLIGSALCAAAQSMPMLILTRALQGIGGGAIGSLTQAIVGDLAPARSRSKYLALIGTVATVSLVAGPLLGGLFAGDLSWRWIFLINLPIGLAALAIIGARLQLPVHRSRRRIDYLGSVLVTVFTAALLLATVWGGDRYAWGSPTIIGLIAVAVVSLLAYLLTEARAPEAITPLRLFRGQVFSISFAQFGLATLVLFVPLLYIPEMRQQVYGDSAFVAGLFVIPLLVGIVLATIVSGEVIARSGRYKIFPVLGAFLAGVPLYLLSLFTAATPGIWMAALLAVAGAGIGLFVQVALLAGQNDVAPADLGVATGALNFAKTLGGALGAAVFGAILTASLRGPGRADYVSAYHHVFFWTVPLMVISLILALVMREKPLSQDMLQVVEGKVEVPEY